MPNSNFGPSTSSFVNEVPLRGTFDTNGKLLQILGSGQSVAFDPANVAITGGVFRGIPSIMPTAFGGIVRVGDLSKAINAIAAATAASPTTHVSLGDSTTAGLGSGQGTNWTNAAQRNVSYQLAAVSGGLISNDSFIGEAGGSGAPGYSIYNPLVILGNGWSGAVATIGGMFFKYAVGGTGTLRMMLPTTGSVKVRFYYLPGGTATVQTDIGIVGTIPAGSGGITSLDFLVQSNATYIEIASPSTTTYILGMAAINSTQKVLRLNAGYNGGKISDFIPAVNNYDALPALGSLAPSLTEINLTINDANAPTAKITYQAGMVTLIEKALLTGSVILNIGCISNTAASTNGSLFDIQSVIAGIATTYNLTVLSAPQALGGGFANAVANGFMADAFHPTFIGHTAWMTQCQLRLLNTMRVLNSQIT